MPPKPPAQLADFEILRRLGAGGMAEVFLAKKRGAEGTYKLLVVKRILPAHGSSRRFRTMFVEEAHLATRLNHPNIVQVYEFSDHGDEGLLLSMEYVEGFDLAKLMNAAKQKGVQIPRYVAAFIVSEAAKGLHYAHERKDEGGMPLAIVHRDVSPQNILLSCEGVVKIADFGIAQATLFHEDEGVIKGKFNYMSPEQARGEKVDRRSDIFALGVVFYELLTLRSPYGKLDDDRLLEAVRKGAFEPPSTHAPDAPPELEAIVLRAMAHSAGDRFQTGRDMAAAIARVLLEKQELIDNTSVESILLDLLGRVPLSQSAPPVAPKQAETLAEVKRQKPPPSGEGRDSDNEPPARPGPGPRIVREVRHVAVVTLQIKGLEELERVQGRHAAKRSADSIRQTLENIAYKRGAIWSWEVPSSGLPSAANAVVGLLANPARAAADAASLAIDTHEALAGASEDLPVALRAAISIVRGIASGERDSRGHLINHSMQGSVSDIAGQLGACTPFGTTWVSGGVYRLVRRDFRWGDAPSLDIARAAELGVPPQMRVYALERPLTREERAAEIAVMPNDLVGRDAEKADLHAAYYRALTPQVSAAQPGQLATIPPPAVDGHPKGEVVTRAVVGEMGIGKTALVSSFLNEVPTAARTVRVECSPVKSELPLATVSDMLREITGLGLDNSIDEAQSVLRGMLGAASRGQMAPRMIVRLAELVTGKNQKTNDDDAPSYRRDLVTVGFRTVLHALARVQPLIVVVDGVQWADRMSLDLLHDMLRRTDPLPILMLLVTRPEERISPYIEGFVRIELKGLTAEEQIRLVEARLGVRSGVPAVCAELVPRVAGNPFFLLEMIDALLERGTLEIVEQAGGQHELIRHERGGGQAEALPTTLEQLIGDRIQELPGLEHDIVDWLAVAGGPLDQSDLLALTRLPHDEAITRLCARGLCDRKGGLVDFRHPLARDVAYLALDAQARARMHRLLGEHLATTPIARGLSAAIVARHLARGDAPERAAHFYLEAAEAARSAHQTQLAQRYYQRALARLPPNDKRIFDAHQALEAIFRHLGRRRERRAHLLALRQLAKQNTRARWAALALVRTARLELDEGYLARGLPVAQKATDIAKLAKHSSIEVEALTILSEILRELGDVQGAIAACERALKVAQTGNLAPKARAEVLQSKGLLLRRVGRVYESVESQVEAIAVFKAVGARRSEARAKSGLAFGMFALERFEDAIALGHESLAIDLAIGGRFQIAKTLSLIGQSYARLGDTARGLAYMQRAREAHERYGDQDSRADTLLGSAWILLEAGDIEGAATLCGDAGALVAVTGSSYDLVHARIVAALIARTVGEFANAAKLAADARQRAEAQGLISYHVYATAIEAASRVDAGEHHTGVLLAHTALGAIEATQGSEYGVEVRALSSEALQRGSTAEARARDAVMRSASHAQEIGNCVQNDRLRALFFARPIVQRIMSEAKRYGGRGPSAGPNAGPNGGGGPSMGGAP
jgi:serine/threonine protein kinase/tetratricopeptide (TPR) repeat protein